MRILLLFIFITLFIHTKSQTINWSSSHPYPYADGTNTFSGSTNTGSIAIASWVQSCSDQSGGCSAGETGYGFADYHYDYNYNVAFYDAGGVLVSVSYTIAAFYHDDCPGTDEIDYVKYSWSGGSYAIAYVEETTDETQYDIYSAGNGECYYNTTNNSGTAQYPLGTPPTPMPIELVTFIANKDNEGIQLKWTTATEINASHFMLERSLDTRFWVSIAKIKAKGNTTKLSHYNWVDDNQSTGIVYYRLKLVDLDQSYKYSPIVSVEKSYSKEEIVCYPNPTTDDVYVLLPKESTTIDVQLMDVTGKELVVNYEKVNGNKWLIHTGHLSKGLYSFKVTTANGSVYTRNKLIKK